MLIMHAPAFMDLNVYFHSRKSYVPVQPVKNNKFKYQWYHRCALRLNEILNNLWTAESIYLITITYLYKFRKKKLVPHQIIHETPNTSTNFNNSLLSGETFANLNLQIQVPTYWVRHTKKMIEDYFCKSKQM